MKNYAYTAKDATGALTRGILSAADRAAALETLRSRGLMPVKVEETSAAPTGRRNVPPRVLAYAAMALILLAGGVWLALSRRGADENAPVSPAATAPKTPIKSPPSPAAVDVPQTAEGAAEQPVMPASTPKGPRPTPAVPTVVPTATRSVPSAATTEEPPEEEEKKKEPLFKFETEQMLALYATPGMNVPPTPFSPDFEQDMLESLKTDIVITSDDTPEDIQKKELVAWMKDDLRKHIANGGSVEEFFTIIEKRQEEEAERLQEARRLIYLVDKEGNTRETQEAHRALNEALKEKGIAPLPLPGNLRRALK